MARALLAALLAVALLAAPAAAATPQASLPDIEDEVMCLECGTALNVSNSDVADQERDFIAGLVAQGMTKQQIKDRLVATYGPNILATPQGSGFTLAVWWVPVAVVLALLGLIALLLPRWRRARAPADAADEPDDPELSATDARRLEQDLARYDV